MAGMLDWVDLASVRLGGAVLVASDEFFGAKDSLLDVEEPVAPLEGGYTDRGKWMDGWETRRKRALPGHDWCVVRLGVPGILREAVVDTTFFRANVPEECSIEGCAARVDASLDEVLGEKTEWFELVPRARLEGDAKNRFAVASPHAVTHVRLNIVPDGGVARLRLLGEALPDWRRIGHARGEVDLAAVEHGGTVPACSDMRFGEALNLVMPGRAANASEGWETRRRRGPGCDWALVALGAAGTVTRVEVDTSHFKGNYPETCSLEACFAPGATAEQLEGGAPAWRELLPRTKLHGHTRHYFEDELAALGPVTHVRLNVFPDGGVSRLRVFGTLDDDARKTLGLRRFNALTPRAAEPELRSCCGSTAWVRAMLEQRPFASVDALFEAADAAWSRTGPDDWREAFRAHPRIGERKAEAGQSAVAKRWSSQEQSGAAQADAEARAALAEVNREYEARFGHIYIVCATGKTAQEMLAIARARMDHAPDVELRVAAAEQHKITRIRLGKMLEP